MAKKKLYESVDKTGILVKVGDSVLARRPFPYTSELIVRKVKNITDKGINLVGEKEVFTCFYKLAFK